jgi:hypothetical protein
MSEEMQEAALEIVSYLVLPSAAAAALFLGLVVLLVGNRAANIAAVVALFIGFLAGNYSLGVKNHVMGNAQPAEETAELADAEPPPPQSAIEKLGDWAGSVAPLPWKPTGAGWHWLPEAAFLVILVGFVTRWRRVPFVAALLLRLSTALHAAWFLVPTGLRLDPLWSMPAFAVVVTVEWTILDHLAEKRGTGGLLPLTATLFFLGAAVLIMQAHFKRAADVAIFSAASMAGIAVVACWRRAEVSSVLPALAVMLPGLVLNGWYWQLPAEGLEPNHQIPWECFVLAALTPLVLVPALLPFWQRRTGWLAQLVIVLLAVLAVASTAVWVLQAEPLEQEKTDDWSAIISRRVSYIKVRDSAVAAFARMRGCGRNPHSGECGYV